MNNIAKKTENKTREKKLKFSEDEIRTVLKKAKGNLSKAAKLLDMTPQNLNYYLKCFPDLRAIIDEIKANNNLPKEKRIKVADIKRNNITGRTNKYTVGEVRIALEKTNGLQTYAARLLNCTLQTVTNYIKRYPELQQFCMAVEETVLDMAENNIRQALKSGDIEQSKWYLRYKGRRRGYYEKETDDSGATLVSPIPVSHEVQQKGIDYLRDLQNEQSNNG